MRKFEYMEILEPKYNRSKKQLQEHLNKLKAFFEKYNVKNINITEIKYLKLAYTVKGHRKGLLVIIQGELQENLYQKLNAKILDSTEGTLKKDMQEILKNYIIAI